MNDPGTEILNLVAARGGMCLAGNREYYSLLKYRDGQWRVTDGDPMTGEETVSAVDPAGALASIRARVRDRMEFHGPDRGDPPMEAILAWLEENPHI